jgi:hypothetical protein
VAVQFKQRCVYVCRRDVASQFLLNCNHYRDGGNACVMILTTLITVSAVDRSSVLRHDKMS